MELTRSLEHIEHSLCYGESSADVDRRDKCSTECEGLGCVCRSHASSHQVQSACRRYARYCIRNTHERAVKSRSYSPHLDYTGL